nr:hypothetical protein [Tanacetum cinerariifolium]
MEMLFTINPRPRPTVNANAIVESFPSLPIPVEDSDSQREEIDIVTDTDDVLPQSVENDDDSEGEIDVVEELLSDNSIPFTEDEASDSDHKEDLSFPRPPLEPPDAEFDFEPDVGKEIPVVKKMSLMFLMMKMMITFLSCLSSESFCHILSVPRCLFLFSPQRVKTPSLTLDLPLSD